MTLQPVVCSKCGFTNVAGDQFCGSCGAFLEWEAAANAADSATTQGTDGSGGTSATTGAPGGAGGGWASTGTGAGTTAGSGSAPATWGGAQTSTGPIAADPTPAGGLLRCPACGIANPPTRTFCQSCGTKLVPQAAIATKSRDEIAAAVAGVPATTWTTPTPPTGAGAGVANPPAKKRGIGILVLAIVVLGVLAGVGFVVVPQLLKGSGPTSVASAAPSASGAAAASAPASAGASGGTSSAAPASGAPSASPVAGKPLKLTGASASSILLGDTANYGPQNVIDGSLKTSWQEGAADESGQWVQVTFAPSTVTSMVIRNGFDKSSVLFKSNLRLKDVLISINGGTPVPFTLQDTSIVQRIPLPTTPGATTIRVTIVDTYPSVKTSVSGSPFDDAAVSEILVYGTAGG